MHETREKTQLMSASEIDRTLVRLAHEILERSGDVENLAFVGIQRRGVPLAARLARKIEELEKRKVPVGSVGIQHHRDDHYREDQAKAAQQPVANSTDIPFDVNGKDVILVDDVLHTGRTVRAAIDALLAQGRPARVQLLVLIDRGHRELPIEARYVGRAVATKRTENIDVQFQEIDGAEKVFLTERVE
jgi:pyrimidine operon attenuation protein/uracil phosphoribosyltransferase